MIEANTIMLVENLSRLVIESLEDKKKIIGSIDDHAHLCNDKEWPSQLQVLLGYGCYILCISLFFWFVFVFSNNCPFHSMVETYDKDPRNNTKLYKLHESFHPIPDKDKAWSQIGMDLMGPLPETKNCNKYIMTINCTCWLKLQI